MKELEDSAYLLASEIREGKWDHIDCIHVKPVPACTDIINELRNRCPGYSVERYQKELADALFASR